MIDSVKSFAYKYLVLQILNCAVDNDAGTLGWELNAGRLATTPLKALTFSERVGWPHTIVEILLAGWVDYLPVGRTEFDKHPPMSATVSVRVDPLNPGPITLTHLTIGGADGLG